MKQFIAIAQSLSTDSYLAIAVGLVILLSLIVLVQGILINKAEKRINYLSVENSLLDKLNEDYSEELLNTPLPVHYVNAKAEEIEIMLRASIPYHYVGVKNKLQPLTLSSNAKDTIIDKLSEAVEQFIKRKNAELDTTLKASLG